MQQVARRAAGILLALLAGGALTACGSSDPGGTGGTGGTASPTGAAGPVERPYATASQAAIGFSGWFQADATDCGDPDFVLNGRLPQAMLDGFSCHQVLTPAEIRQGCEHGPLAANTAPHTKPATLAPGRMRFVVGWGRTMQCAGGRRTSDKGTFQVVVEKYADGWSVTSYKILTGPGAGSAG